jgi:hypothetical protein
MICDISICDIKFQKRLAHYITRAAAFLRRSAAIGDGDKMTAQTLKALANNTGLGFHGQYGGRWNYMLNFSK